MSIFLFLSFFLTPAPAAPDPSIRSFDRRPFQHDGTEGFMAGVKFPVNCRILDFSTLLPNWEGLPILLEGIHPSLFRRPSAVVFGPCICTIHTKDGVHTLAPRIQDPVPSSCIRLGITPYVCTVHVVYSLFLVCLFVFISLLLYLRQTDYCSSCSSVYDVDYDIPT